MSGGTSGIGGVSPKNGNVSLPAVYQARDTRYSGTPRVDVLPAKVVDPLTQAKHEHASAVHGKTATLWSTVAIAPSAAIGVGVGVGLAVASNPVGWAIGAAALVLLLLSALGTFLYLYVFQKAERSAAERITQLEQMPTPVAPKPPMIVSPVATGP